MVFTTTNNVYESVCKRGEGTAGFEAMFKPAVPWGYRGTVERRRTSCPDNQPTHRQAEVLYPGKISFEHLQRIYVPGHEHRRLVLAWCDVLGQDEATVEVRKDLFS